MSDVRPQPINFPSPPHKRGPRGSEHGAGRPWTPACAGATMQITVAILLSLALAGCGKRNDPVPPPDVPITYPRPYPSV